MKIKLDREIWEAGQRRWHSCIQCDFQTMADTPDMRAVQQEDITAARTIGSKDANSSEGGQEDFLDMFVWLVPFAVRANLSRYLDLSHH
jgi:hypothetical protein